MSVLSERLRHYRRSISAGHDGYHGCDCITDAANELDSISSKLSRIHKLLDDWAEAERQCLGAPILLGIEKLREALK